MMDTILNLGLNSQTVKGLAGAAGERFALDCRRRFLQMYGDVVMNLGKEDFEHALTEKRNARGVKSDADLTAEDLAGVVKTYEGIIREKTGKPFPEDPQDQLWGAIGAVFKSWDNKRAREYRRLHRIPHDWGTAVNVQAMVFGNRGETSATGVAFTRDPSTGEKKFYGEFLPNAQGEDVVAGSDPASLERRRLGHLARGDDAEGARRAAAGPGPPREELPRHAGPRVHDRGRPPLRPPDTQRKAHRLRRRPDRLGHGR